MRIIHLRQAVSSRTGQFYLLLRSCLSMTEETEPQGHVSILSTGSRICGYPVNIGRWRRDVQIRRCDDDLEYAPTLLACGNNLRPRAKRQMS